MSDTIESIRRKLSSAGDLQSVVRTMKALAASSIGQYEKSVSALADYYHTVELGLGACLRNSPHGMMQPESSNQNHENQIGAIVFGSDQGLVGQFNDVIASYAIQQLSSLPGKPAIWAVGERVHGQLTDAGFTPLGLFPVPNSVKAISPLIGKIQLQSEAHRTAGGYTELHVFYNHPKSGALYEPVNQRLLPLDATWQKNLTNLPWATKLLPEVISTGTTALRSLIREFLFISLFRACAESLASENASRLAAMQRAENNIEDLLETLNSDFHRLRQSGIDEELFDVISGYEALSK